MLGAIIAGVGGLVGAMGARSAANAQVEAAEKQAEVQKYVYKDAKKLFEPFYDGGLNAYDAYMYEMGLGERPTYGGSMPEIESFTESVWNPNAPSGMLADLLPTSPRDGGGWNIGMFHTDADGGGNHQNVTKYRVNGQVFDNHAAAAAFAADNATDETQYGGYTKTPGYDFRLNEGLSALQNSAAARGDLFGGQTGQDLVGYGQDYATNEYQNYLAKLRDLAGMGQSSAGQTAVAGQNYATGMSNAYANMGNAQAAGYTGMANSVNNAISNGLGIWNYQQLMNNGG